MDAKNYDALRDLTLNAEDLYDPWNYFLEHFGNNRQFVQQSKRNKKGKSLTPILNVLAEQTLGESIGEHPIHLFKVKKQPLLHGLVPMDSGFLSFYFFTDIKAGLAASLNRRSHLTSFARLRALIFDEGAIPMMAKGDANLTH